MFPIPKIKAKKWTQRQAALIDFVVETLQIFFFCASSAFRTDRITFEGKEKKKTEEIQNRSEERRERSLPKKLDHRKKLKNISTERPFNARRSHWVGKLQRFSPCLASNPFWPFTIVTIPPLRPTTRRNVRGRDKE